MYIQIKKWSYYMRLGEQLKADLKQRILSLPDGTKFATEAELCTEFGVSRMTVNKVLGKLAAEGLLKRFPRRGTFVCHKMIEVPEITGTIFEMRHRKLRIHIDEYRYSKTRSIWNTVLQKLKERMPGVDVIVADSPDEADLVWCSTRAGTKSPTLSAVTKAPAAIAALRKEVDMKGFFPCSLPLEHAALPLELSTCLNLWNGSLVRSVFGAKAAIPKGVVQPLLNKNWHAPDFPLVVSYLFCPLILLQWVCEGAIGYNPVTGHFDFHKPELREYLEFNRKMFERVSVLLDDYAPGREVEELLCHFIAGDILVLNTFSPQLQYLNGVPDIFVKSQPLGDCAPAIGIYIGIGHNARSYGLAARAASLICGDELSSIAAGFQRNIPARRSVAYSQEFLNGMPQGMTAVLEMLDKMPRLFNADHFFIHGKEVSELLGRYIIGDFTYHDIHKKLINSYSKKAKGKTKQLLSV